MGKPKKVGKIKRRSKNASGRMQRDRIGPGPSADERAEALRAYAAFDNVTALQKAETMIRNYPHDFFGWKIKAAVLVRCEEFSNAKPVVERAYQLSPEDIEVRGVLASTYIGLGLLDDAISVARNAIELDDTIGQLHFLLGRAYMGMERDDEAIESFQTAVKLDKSLADGFNNLGNIFLKHQQVEKALESYDQAVAVRPDYAFAHYNRANLFQKAGHLFAASTAYRMAIACNPLLREAYNNLGTVMRLIGRPTEALKNFDAARALDPSERFTISNRLMAMNYCESTPASSIFEAHRSSDCSGPKREFCGWNKSPDRKLRVGFVSADFR